MSEIITLTSPVTRPSRASVQITSLSIDVEGQTISVAWRDNNNERFTAVYPTPAPQGSSQPTGAALITSLNTANLTANSLVRRVMTRLQTDGYIPAGSVSGTPD